MAAAEARAVWQRTANRCFVQEDAKRAPKLACCQSSSSTKQVDSSPTGAADTNHHPATGFMPLNGNPSYSNLPPDTRWWLQLQPSYGPQMGLTKEQLNALEDEVESLKAEINSPSKVSKAHQQDSHDISLDSTQTTENWEFLDMESAECQASMKTNDFCCEPESPWSGCGKTEPWWRTTDKYELASLVAQKSLDFIENCDLPPPQNVNMSPDSIRKHGTQISSVGEGKMQRPSNTLSSTSTTEKDILEQVTESDPTKAQLLEALCHSQTRAREAEKAAKQAYAEKEHVIRLVFKQASQLFAYKQWFQILQLEALHVQIKNSEQPPVLPWTSYKSQKMRKGWQKTGKERRRKQGWPRPDLTKYAVALALGLGLVGAGLLLGWTVGWMLPF
ncbi:hypothetical protein GQ457_04G030570 [Hibiscus cannabinus]